MYLYIILYISYMQLIYYQNSSFIIKWIILLMNNISKQVLETYKTLLRYSKLTLHQEISFRNVNLSQQSHIHQIYTRDESNVDDSPNRVTKPHLVLLHGFAGSAMSYIRTFYSLSRYFHVHALDHFGNGFSTRSTIDPNHTHNQILNLYTNSIQQWRKQTNLNNFILAGHSFGAYIASLYTRQYHHVVDRLILLSPVGTSRASQIHNQIQTKKLQSIKNKIILSIIQKIYNLNIQPSKIFSTPIIGDLLVKMFLISTIKLEKQQKQAWEEYIKYISEQESHLEKAFYQCFNWPFVSKMESISDIIEEIVVKDARRPIEFYYGENDWTESIDAKKLHLKHQNVHFQVIPKATHNMIFDFPQEVADRIINQPMSVKSKI